jgi:glutamate synthase (NADPH/NADH) large chain
MAPMATTGQEAIGSMGTDTPISAMSDKSKLLYTYFKQNFAQVTNPPIDPIREELVMSLVSFIGPRPNLFDHKGAVAKKKRLEVRQPILTNGDLEKIRSIGHTEDRFDTKTLDFTYSSDKGADGMKEALERLCDRAEEAVPAATTSSSCRTGRSVRTGSRFPRCWRRQRCTSPDPQGPAHLRRPRGGIRRAARSASFACLAGYGAEAINPYLAFDTLLDMHASGEFPPEVDSTKLSRATSRRSARASSR